MTATLNANCHGPWREHVGKPVEVVDWTPNRRAVRVRLPGEKKKRGPLPATWVSGIAAQGEKT
jgi:hypothetical protein